MRLQSRPTPLTVARSLLYVAFALWSAAFIQKTSVVVEDGTRYFCLADDAMISMRYAWNVAHGNGAVWNPGDRVEGYSNPLYMLLMVPGNFLLPKRLASLAMHLLGILIMIGCASSAGAVASRLLDVNHTDKSGEIVRAVGSVTASAVVLAYYPLTYWTLMGMEVGAATLLALVALRVASGPAASTIALRVSMIAGVAYLTRPDAILLVLPSMILFMYRAWRLEGKVLAYIRNLASPVAAIVTLHVWFRVSYYGEWLPNTYVLKIRGIPLGERISNGVAYVGPFLREHSWLLGVAVLAPLIVKGPLAWAVLGIAANSLVYQVWIGGDPWWYWRMLAPGSAMLLTLAVAALFGLQSCSRGALVGWHFGLLKYLQARSTWMGLAIAMAIALVASATWRFRGESWFLQDPYESDFSRRNVLLARAIERELPVSAKIAVFSAGAIPYFSGRPAIDLLGKNEKGVARLDPDLRHVPRGGMSYMPGHNKYSLNATFDLYRPDFIEAGRWGTEELRPDILESLRPFHPEGLVRVAAVRDAE